MWAVKLKTDTKNAVAKMQMKCVAFIVCIPRIRKRSTFSAITCENSWWFYRNVLIAAIFICAHWVRYHYAFHGFDTLDLKIALKLYWMNNRVLVLLTVLVLFFHPKPKCTYSIFDVCWSLFPAKPTTSRFSALHFPLSFAFK